jgi:hypothetical protein
VGFRLGGLGRRATALAVVLFAAPVLAVMDPMAAQAGATVSLVSSSQWGPDGTGLHLYHFVGEVINGGDTTSKPYNVANIRITATNTLSQAVDTVDAEAAILGPGQKSPFDVVTS